MRWKLGVFLIAICSWAQQPAPPGVRAETFRAKTLLVETEVRVTNKSGEPLAGLTAADFILREDGERQEISAGGSLSTPRTLAAWTRSAQSMNARRSPCGPIGGPARR